jgi:hypothetical protein
MNEMGRNSEGKLFSGIKTMIFTWFGVIGALCSEKEDSDQLLVQMKRRGYLPVFQQKLLMGWLTTFVRPGFIPKPCNSDDELVNEFLEEVNQGKIDLDPKFKWGIPYNYPFLEMKSMPTERFFVIDKSQS